jgi:methylmalonyl-CoA/ethylmalonyl-CoA epimerase
MAKVLRIDHIGILVDDLEQPLSFWRDALGLEMTHMTDVPAELAQVAFLPVGGSELELVRPTTSDSGMARFLEKRGPGVHHICLEVDDIDGMLAQLEAKGVTLINNEARTDVRGKRYAFVHPKSTNGVLVELYELTKV